MCHYIQQALTYWQSSSVYCFCPCVGERVCTCMSWYTLTYLDGLGRPEVNNQVSSLVSVTSFTRLAGQQASGSPCLCLSALVLMPRFLTQVLGVELWSSCLCSKPFIALSSPLQVIKNNYCIYLDLLVFLGGGHVCQGTCVEIRPGSIRRSSKSPYLLSHFAGSVIIFKRFMKLRTALSLSHPSKCWDDMCVTIPILHSARIKGMRRPA